MMVCAKVEAVMTQSAIRTLILPLKRYTTKQMTVETKSTPWRLNKSTRLKLRFQLKERTRLEEIDIMLAFRRKVT